MKKTVLIIVTSLIVAGIGLGMKQSANEQSEKEKLRREQIQSHESYRKILEMSRTQLERI